MWLKILKLTWTNTTMPWRTGEGAREHPDHSKDMVSSCHRETFFSSGAIIFYRIWLLTKTWYDRWTGIHERMGVSFCVWGRQIKWSISKFKKFVKNWLERYDFDNTAGIRDDSDINVLIIYFLSDFLIIYYLFLEISTSYRFIKVSKG